MSELHEIDCATANIIEAILQRSFSIVMIVRRSTESQIQVGSAAIKHFVIISPLK